MDFEEAAEENAVRKTVFFKEEFRQLIEKCDVNRRVAVLTVAGKGNKGKSVFISFVLRYLQALQKGKADGLELYDSETVGGLQMDQRLRRCDQRNLDMVGTHYMQE